MEHILFLTFLTISLMSVAAELGVSPCLLQFISPQTWYRVDWNTYRKRKSFNLSKPELCSSLIRSSQWCTHWTAAYESAFSKSLSRRSKRRKDDFTILHGPPRNRSPLFVLHSNSLSYLLLLIYCWLLAKIRINIWVWRWRTKYLCTNPLLAQAVWESSRFLL